MTKMITQNAPSLQDHLNGFKTLYPNVSYRSIAKEAGVSTSSVCNAAKGSKQHRPIRKAIEDALIRMAEREVAKKAFCDGVNAAHYALIDDQIESAGSREKAELQTALVARIDQIAALEQKLHKASEQAQSSLADLTKANKRISCQSENIEILQQQLSAERVSYSDKIESLQSDLDILKHEYAKAQHAITDRDTRITQITQDKIDLSHKRDRLKSRAEVFKITAFTAGMALLVALVYVIFGELS